MDKLFVASLSNYFQKKDEKISKTTTITSAGPTKSKKVNRYNNVWTVFDIYTDHHGTIPLCTWHKQREWKQLPALTTHVIA